MTKEDDLVNMERKVRNCFVDPTCGIIGFVLLCVFGAILLFMGLSFGAALLAVALVPFAIFLGYLGELVGSFIFIFLFRTLHVDILAFVNIWLESPKINKTFDLLLSCGWVKAITIVFFIVFTLRFLTGSIKLLRVSSSSSSGTS